MSDIKAPAVREGRCKAYPFCKAECQAYVSRGIFGNFETCVYTHTQAVHEVTT